MNTSGLSTDRAGVSLKSQHFQFILEHLPAIGFFEIHPENYMSPGGIHLQYLEKISQQYPLSMHGVGLSLGSVDGVKDSHLDLLHDLAQRFEPKQVSEHLSWSHWNDIFLNDLLPLPYNQESLNIVLRNIEKTQERLQRSILIENPSIYINFENQEYSETEFLKKLCKQSGCGLLLDLNNIVVSAHNNNFCPQSYLKEIPYECIGEVHLAGHKNSKLIDEKIIKIDDHGSKVPDEVWQLLEHLISHSQKPLPLLVEWDTNIPAFDVLQTEATKAQQLMQKTLTTTPQANQSPAC